MKRRLDRFGFTRSDGCPDPKISAVDNSVRDRVKTERSKNTLGLDIGECVGKKLTDHEKMTIVKRKWKPLSGFEMPYTTRMRKGKVEKGFLRMDHFERFNWLTYSESKEGLFCKACVLFDKREGGIGNQDLKTLIIWYRSSSQLFFSVNVDWPYEEQMKVALFYLIIIQAKKVTPAMSGLFSGVQAEIRRQVPSSTYVHCANHCLNLTISKSCQISQGSLGRQSVCLDYHEDKKHRTQPP
uniref:TTF-type domain-containing protein n=1 Tax=Romanomermis culicivorax TaxID=13658 RepID=A0A915HIQ7_ROMCU